MHAHTRVAEILKKSGRLILNDARLLLYTIALYID